MRKGSIMDEIGWAILTVIAIIVIGTIFYYGGEKVKSLISVISPENTVCASSGKSIFNYQIEVDNLQDKLNKEPKESASYQENKKKLDNLFKEIQECGFADKVKHTS